MSSPGAHESSAAKLDGCEVGISHGLSVAVLLRARSTQARDLGLDRTEEGVVNVPACMPEYQHCRTHQAVRDRNDGIPACRRDQLGPEARWRGQHAADDDAATHDNGTRQIRRAYGRKEVRERRCCADQNRASHSILMGGEGERCEVGQRDGRPCVQGGNQLPQCLFALAGIPRIAIYP